MYPSGPWVEEVSLESYRPFSIGKSGGTVDTETGFEGISEWHSVMVWCVWGLGRLVSSTMILSLVIAFAPPMDAPREKLWNLSRLLPACRFRRKEGETPTYGGRSRSRR